MFELVCDWFWDHLKVTYLRAIEYYWFVYESKLLASIAFVKQNSLAWCFIKLSNSILILMGYSICFCKRSTCICTYFYDRRIYTFFNRNGLCKSAHKGSKQ